MSIWEALHRLLTGPAELLMEVVFALTGRIIMNYGIMIILLSIVINIPVLLLYHLSNKDSYYVQEKRAK